MESKVKRTLVKSAPELWELADDRDRLELWMGGLAGASQPVAVEVTARDPERILVWRATQPGQGPTRISLELAEKGFGTAVSITAEHSHPDADDVSDALERLLDDLGSPERRPFERN